MLQNHGPLLLGPGGGGGSFDLFVGAECRSPRATVFTVSGFQSLVSSIFLFRVWACAGAFVPRAAAKAPVLGQAGPLGSRRLWDALYTLEVCETRWGPIPACPAEVLPVSGPQTFSASTLYSERCQVMREASRIATTKAAQLGLSLRPRTSTRR